MIQGRTGPPEHQRLPATECQIVFRLCRRKPGHNFPNGRPDANVCQPKQAHGWQPAETHGGNPHLRGVPRGAKYPDKSGDQALRPEKSAGQETQVEG